MSTLTLNPAISGSCSFGNPISTIFLSVIDSSVKDTLHLLFRYRCLSKLGVLADSFCLSNKTQIHPKIIENKSSRKENGAVFQVQVYERSKYCLQRNLSCVIYNLYKV